MSTNSANWHQFRETYEGDDACDTCKVVVSTPAHLSFTLPCPVPACTSRNNPDPACVFVPGRGDVAACIYCGHRGTRDGDGPPPDPELDAMIAELIAD